MERKIRYLAYLVLCAIGLLAFIGENLIEYDGCECTCEEGE